MWIKGLNWLVADTLRAATPLQIERWELSPVLGLCRFPSPSPVVLPPPQSTVLGCTAAHGQQCPQCWGGLCSDISSPPLSHGDPVSCLCERVPLTAPSQHPWPDTICVPFLPGGSGSSSTHWTGTGRTGMKGSKHQLHRHTCSQEGGLCPQCLNPSVDQSPISQPLTPRKTFETVSPQPALPVGQTAKNCQCFAWLKSQSRGYFQLLIPLGPRASSLSHLPLLRAALGGSESGIPAKSFQI